MTTFVSRLRWAAKPLAVLAVWMFASACDTSTVTSENHTDKKPMLGAPPALNLFASSFTARTGAVLSASSALLGDELKSGFSGLINAGQWSVGFAGQASDYRAGDVYTATVTPGYGDPDLYLFGWNGNQWVYLASSMNGAGAVDRLQYRTTDNRGFTHIYFWIYGYTSAGFNFELRSQTAGTTNSLWPLQGGYNASRITTKHGDIWKNSAGAVVRYCATAGKKDQPWRHVGVDIGGT